MRKGQIFRKGRSWFLRYREPVLENGRVTHEQRCKTLAPCDGAYRTKRAVAPLAQRLLAPINEGTFRPESTQRLSDFIEWVYLPFVEKNKAPSTTELYRGFFEDHIKSENNRLLD
jgi:hypothetical protein